MIIYFKYLFDYFFSSSLRYFHFLLHYFDAHNAASSLPAFFFFFFSLIHTIAFRYFRRFLSFRYYAF